LTKLKAEEHFDFFTIFNLYSFTLLFRKIIRVTKVSGKEIFHLGEDAFVNEIIVL